MNYILPTTIKGIFNQMQVFLTPNPTDKTLTIKLSEPITTLDVFSLAGVKLLSSKGIYEEMTLDVSTLISGIYTVRINDNYATTFIKR